MMVPCRLLAMMMGFCKSLSKTLITLITEIWDSLRYSNVSRVLTWVSHKHRCNIILSKRVGPVGNDCKYVRQCRLLRNRSWCIEYIWMRQQCGQACVTRPWADICQHVQPIFQTLPGYHWKCTSAASMMNKRNRWMWATCPLLILSGIILKLQEKGYGRELKRRKRKKRERWLGPRKRLKYTTKA